ncbi:MAG: YceI family protein [Deltaproteobacteria bacterium]|nr:YceI family protein [Deltaproteobacteria bacterium]
MARFDATSAETLIHTFKEGLLSAVAHDLELRVDSFTVDVDEAAATVSARFDARSIHVVAAMKHGVKDPSVLSASDRRKIDDNLASDVLDSRRHPEITFTSTRATREGTGWRVEGALKLHGRERTITVPVTEQAGRRIAEVRLHQPDFGIKPYSAMLGTLKVKPEILVRVSLPAA